MSSTTSVLDFSDIYTEILNKMKQPTNNTALTAQAKRYANTALQDMVFGFEYKMPWLEREAFITTMAPYTTGTVSITRGSTTVTGDSTLWTTNNAYGVANARTTGKMTFGGSDVYKISTVAASSITLTNRYVADTDLAVGSEYVYFEDEYALASDFLKMVDIRQFTQAYNIPLIGRDEFRRHHPRPNSSGLPKYATLLDKSFVTTSTQPVYVQFYPYPSTNLIIPYNYITKNLAVTAGGTEATAMSGDTDEPQLPVRYRHALVAYAIWQWYRDKKDDSRSEAAKAEYQDLVNRIVGDQRIGANTMARLQPKVGMYKGRTYSGGRHFSTNNSFDDYRT
jgi:hypothetical protein